MSPRRRRGAFTCRYLSFYDPRLKRTFRLPLVHIRVKHNDLSFRTDALVDSGATATFLPLEIAEILGIDTPKETHDAVGAGGIFPTYHSKIDQIDVFKGTKVFCELCKISVIIPVKAGAIPHTILGRDTIFWENDITFRERRQHTIFRNPPRT